MTAHLVDNRRFGIVEEDAPNTFKDAFLAANTNVRAYVANTGFEAASDENEQQTGSASIDATKPFVGNFRGTIRVRAAIRGSGTTNLSTKPDVHDWLQSCTMGYATGWRIAGNLSTGTVAQFAPGAIAVQQTTGATCVVYDINEAGNELLVYSVANGVAAGVQNVVPDNSSIWDFAANGVSFEFNPSAVPVEDRHVYYPETKDPDKAYCYLRLAAQPTDTDPMNIGGDSYQFVNSLSSSGDILIGATLADTQANAVAAVNGTGTPGTQYHASTTANANARLSVFDNDHAIVLAKTAGSGGNSLAVTETFTSAENQFQDRIGATADSVAVSTLFGGKMKRYSVAMFNEYGTLQRTSRIAQRSCIGTFTWTGDNVAQPAYFDFSEQGALVSPKAHEDIALPTGIAQQTHDAPAFNGVAMTILTSTAQSLDVAEMCLAQFSFDLGNENNQRQCITSPEGIKDFATDRRAPTAQLTPLMLEDTIHNFLQDFQDSNELRLSLEVGDTAGNKVRLIVPRLVPTGYSTAERGAETETPIPCRAITPAEALGNNIVYIEFS